MAGALEGPPTQRGQAVYLSDFPLFFLFGLLFQLWMNQKIWRGLARVLSIDPEGEKPVPTAPSAADGTPTAPEAAAADAGRAAVGEAGRDYLRRSLHDSQLIFSLRSWPVTLAWQYFIVLILAGLELWSGEAHGQIVIDAAGWAAAFACLDLGVLTADLVTVLRIRRRLRRKDPPS